MGIIRKYIEYLKENPEGYWFKRKLYGWGWVPARWQGWVVIGVYVGILILLGSTLDENSSDREAVFMFVLPLLILTSALITICYKKGEKPRWQWGLPKKDE